MVGQSESDDIFVFGVKVNELMIQGHQFCFSYSNGKIKMLIHVITMGSLIFGIEI